MTELSFPGSSSASPGSTQVDRSRRDTGLTRKVVRTNRQRLGPRSLAFDWLEERKLLSTFTVNNPTDAPIGGETDLRQAITLANSTTGANTIDFDPTVFASAQTITLTGTQLELSNTSGTQTITGPAAGVTVSGGGSSGVFEVNAGVTAFISGLTITGGNNSGDGGGLYNAGTTTLSNCTISGSSAPSGGGLYNQGAATLLDCIVSGNTSTAAYPSGVGGGIDNGSGGMLTVDSSTIINNTVEGYKGGGIYSGTNSTVDLTDTTIEGNRSPDGYGGAISIVGGTGTFTGCSIENNSAYFSGGAIDNYDPNSASLTVTDCTIDGNTADTYAGGGISSSGSLIVIGCTLSGNSA
jgi:hypothetical protein